MMIDWDTPDYYVRHRDDVVRDLAEALRTEILCLMVGAGASHKLNLPLWHELVAACCTVSPGKIDVTGIDENSSGDQLLLRMQRVRESFKGDDDAYLDTVHEQLYAKWKNPNPSTAPELMRAIGVLVMGSVRGRINSIFNFNFDSLLEWYLSLHGYVVQVIEDVPRGLVNADVRVFHPHGYLPLSTSLGQRSPMILFDKAEAEKRVADRGDAWMDVFRFLLGSRVFLAVGLSGKDPMANLVVSAAKHQRQAEDKRPMGFWFYKKGSLDADYENNLRSKSVVLVDCDSYEEISETLFRIAQRAAGAVIV